MTRRVLAFVLGFALALGLILSRPTPADPARPGAAVALGHLPPLPDSIVSFAGWTRVHFEPGVFKCGTVAAWGCYQYETRFMQVDTALAPSIRWQVLEHEKVHMILGDAGLRAGVRDDDAPDVDDKIADAIANYRMLELAATP